MKILLTGGTGFIGRKMCRALALQGHELVLLTRNKQAAKYTVPAPHLALEWSDASGLVHPEDVSVLGNLDAVIHLAGESIIGRRWSPAFKEKIRNSRVDGTRSLIQLLEQSGNSRVKLFITASAVGYYGDCGERAVTESDASGSDFLAQICKEWENTLFNSTLLNTRKIALRIGVVLGKGGGALEKMLPAFTSGAGATLGSGHQWMSWIHVDDLVSIILECIRNQKIAGPVNACSPTAVTNQEFTEVLTRFLKSVHFLNVPSSVLRVALGEVAQTLLTGQRVIPEKLKSLEFQFQYPKIDSAFQAILGDSAALGNEEFLAQLWIPQPIEKVFEFFGAAKNLETITPPWLGFKIRSQSTPDIQKGTLIEYELKLHGIPLKWRTEISQWNPPTHFVDTQLTGPYHFWRHTHRFLSLHGGTLIEDQVLYQLPLGLLGRVVAGSYVRKDVKKIFAYRTQKIFDLLA